MAATKGKGSTLQISISTVFTTVTQDVEFKPPNAEMGKVETTDLSSTWRTFIATILNAGEVEATLNYDSDATTHAQLWTSFQAGTEESWKINFPASQSTIIAFNAFITNHEWEPVNVDGIVKLKIKLQLSGAITITA